MVPSFILSCLLCSIINIVSSARILFVAMPQGKSHRGSMYPFAGTLASRGHEVVLLGLVLEDNSRGPAGFEERLVHVKGADDDFKNGVVYKNSSFHRDIMWNQRFKAKGLIGLWYNYGQICKLFLEHQKNEFLQIAQESWDLIVIDTMFEQCAMALTVVRSDMPYAVFHTNVLEEPVANLRALAVPPHTRCPLYLSPTWLFDCQKFLDRFYAVLLNIELQVIYSWIFHYIAQWSTDAVTEGRLSYPEYIRKSSGDFVEYPNPIDWTKPTGSDVFTIGAYCLNNSKPLSDDLSNFVNDNSSQGTILVAFGTIVNWAIAPQKKVEIFYNALKELTQYRIIWQFRGGEAKFLVPKHMRLMAWLPQIDILNHPKTRLFISHGGLKSYREAICAEVPLLFLPMFAEQPRNAQSAKRFGIGEIVDKLTKETSGIVQLVHQITNTDSYMTNIRKTKAQFVDRVVPSLDEGAFWAEYIIRHGGMPATHRRKGLDLNWMQYWCIDVIALFVAVISFTLYILWRMFCCTTAKIYLRV